MDQSTISRLEQDLQEIQDHYQSASVRVRDYYEDPDGSDFTCAPHDQQFKKAAHYIEYAISEISSVEEDSMDFGGENKSIEWLSRRDWSRLQLEDMLYGISIELIVSAIHLKLDTEEYVDNLIRTNQTPHIEESKRVLFEDLENSLSESQIKEMKLVLNLSGLKRNNLVHFGFHALHVHYFPILFIDVSGFLITRYADTNEIPELESLAQYRVNYAEQRGETETFPEVNLDFKPFS